MFVDVSSIYIYIYNLIYNLILIYIIYIYYIYIYIIYIYISIRLYIRLYIYIYRLTGNLILIYIYISIRLYIYIYISIRLLVSSYVKRREKHTHSLFQMNEICIFLCSNYARGRVVVTSQNLCRHKSCHHVVAPHRQAQAMDPVWGSSIRCLFGNSRFDCSWIPMPMESCKCECAKCKIKVGLSKP